MASDPEVRKYMYDRLIDIGGVVTATSFREVVRRLRPPDCSMNVAKKALNSLAYSTERRPVISLGRRISREGVSASGVMVSASLLSSR